MHPSQEARMKRWFGVALALAAGVAFGKVTCEPVAAALGYPFVDPGEFIH